MPAPRLSGRWIEVLADATAPWIDRIASGVPLVAAVSGGRDSIALALALRHLVGPGRLVLAHVDHGVHAQRRAAARCVHDLARALGAGFAERRLTLPATASEAAMRTARYGALAEIARALGARCIATAHHADDQAETVWFRLRRGTGRLGLAGIPRTRWLGPDLRVVRPLLGVRRAVLARAVAEAGVPHVDDPTNVDLAKARNRIRAVDLPALSARRPDAVEVLCRIAHRQTERALRLDAALAQAAVERFTSPAHWRASWRLLPGDSERLVREAARRIHTALAGAAPLERWLDRVVELARGATGRRVAASGALLVERTREGLAFADLAAAGPPEPCAVPLREDGIAVRLAGAVSAVALCAGDPAGAPAAPHVAVIDGAAAPGPYHLRLPRAGDRFGDADPGGGTALRRRLAAAACPGVDRDRIPLIVDAEGRIVWALPLGVAPFARGRHGAGPAIAAAPIGGIRFAVPSY